jgi:hypothetical protein
MRKLKPFKSIKVVMTLRAPTEEGRYKATFNLFDDRNIQIKGVRLDVKMKVLEQQAV